MAGMMGGGAGSAPQSNAQSFLDTAALLANPEELAKRLNTLTEAEKKANAAAQTAREEQGRVRQLLDENADERDGLLRVQEQQDSDAKRLKEWEDELEREAARLSGERETIAAAIQETNETGKKHHAEIQAFNESAARRKADLDDREAALDARAEMLDAKAKQLVAWNAEVSQRANEYVRKLTALRDIVERDLAKESGK